jgi:type I restriction enzyme, S subunit
VYQDLVISLFLANVFNGSPLFTGGAGSGESDIRKWIIENDWLEAIDDRIENLAADASSYKVARKGDIAFNKMRMWQGAVGVSPTDGLVSPDYVVAEPSAPMNVEYFGLLFKTQIFSAETARHSHGITWDRLRLYWEGFRDIRVPLPPVEEQTAIVESVKEQTAKLDALKTATELTITLLRERRTALIAAAVTGKISVNERDSSKEVCHAH